MFGKRGQLGILAGLSAGVVAILVIGLLVAFFGGLALIIKYALVLGGVAVMILTFVFAIPPVLRGNLTRAKAGFVILLFIVGLAMIFASGMGLVEQTGFEYEVVYKQEWGNICCIQEDDYDISFSNFLVDQSLFVCDHYTNFCEVEIKNVETGWTTMDNVGSYQLCDISGGNCESKQKYVLGTSQVKVLPHLRVGRSYKFTTGILTSGEETSLITLKAKSFYIKGLENGKVYRQESCVLSSELRERVLSGGLNELSKTGANSCQNYMIDFVQVATRTYGFEGRNVICQARQLYEIDNLRFKDGSFNKVQGDLIKAVECCPAEANCDSDSFTFVVDDRKRCTFSSECPNGGSPVATGSNTYVTYDCVSGWCDMSVEKFSECTITAECIRLYGPGSVCDLSPANWGNCIASTKPRHCGDGVCDSVDGENYDTCPADCSIDCPEGTKLRISVEEDWLGRKKFTSECVSDSVIKPWMWFVGIAFFMIVLILLLIGSDRRRR